MDINKLILEKLNRREIYRYLGYVGQAAPIEVSDIVDEVVGNLVKVISPKSIYKKYYCKVVNDDIYLYNNENEVAANFDIHFKSLKLAKNIEGCDKCIILAATLGIEAEKLLYKYEIVNMAKASIAQACGAACIEAYCNIISDEILSNNDGYFLRPRFSPGYGDLQLENQKVIFDSLECSKRLGLTLTDSLLMYPTKSVTAIIGLTKDKESCHSSGCSNCDKKDCEFRYED